MKDPVTLGMVAAGGLTAMGVGTVAGVPVDALIFGLMGGIVAVLAIPPKSDAPVRHGWKLYAALASSIVVSVLVAAALGPMTAEALSLGLKESTAMRGYSFLWGAGAQAGLLLSAIEALRRRIEQLGGGQP